MSKYRSWAGALAVLTIAPATAASQARGAAPFSATFALTAQVVELSFNAYFQTMSATLGFNRTVTLLLCAPPFVFAAIVEFVLSRWVVPVFRGRQYLTRC